MNVLPLTMFCHAFLPDMAKRGKGAIINISSVAGLVPVPYLAVYSATQHYISALTQALAQEYSGSGVVIQEVRNQTKLQGVQKKSLFHFGHPI